MRAHPILIALLAYLIGSYWGLARVLALFKGPSVAAAG